jgi:hypothetical protein
MSDERAEWYYAKLGNDSTFWLVRDGEREKMHSSKQVHEIGLYLVRILTPAELEAIPVKGEL